METNTRHAVIPEGYDPSRFPAFAVTVDVVILTMSEGTLQVLLVRALGTGGHASSWTIELWAKQLTRALWMRSADSRTETAA